MNFAEIIDQLLARAGSDLPGLDLVTADEVEDWEEGCLSALLGVGLLRPASPSRSVLCPACDDGHVAEVIVLPGAPGSPPRAYVNCPAHGMVAIDPASQGKWRIDPEGLARYLAATLTGAASSLVAPGVWRLGQRQSQDARRDLLLFLSQSAFPEWELLGLSSPLALVGELSQHVPGLPQVPLSQLVRIAADGPGLDVTCLDSIVASTRELPTPYLFRREGSLWTIIYEGRALPALTDLKGLHHLAFLLRHPYEQFSPLVLIAWLELDDTPGRAEKGRLPKWELGPRPVQRGMPAVEPEDLAFMKASLRDFDQRIEKARRRGDQLATDRLTEERDGVLREYLRSKNRWGDPRLISSTAAKAANSVTRLITRAIKHIEKEDSGLGRHLDRSVTRSSTCAYRPETPAPPWVF